MHEAVKPKIPEIHFMPEGYVDPDGPEFLEQLLQKLREVGFDITNLVFCGVDGALIYSQDGSIEKPNAIFAMNETGWRDAITKGVITPAGYVKKDADVPCIALYDARHLAEPESYKLRQNLENYWEPVQIYNIVPGDDLAPIIPSDSAQEVIIHEGFPDASPSDVLVGLVFIEEEQYRLVRDHGL